MDGYPVEYQRKIRFSDSDAQGIVFNGNYFTYFDDAATDWFEALGVAWEDLVARGYEMVLGHAEIDFRSPARIGEMLHTGVRVESIGRTSIRLGFQVEEAGGRLVAEGTEVQVIVDATDFRPTPVPGFLIEAIERLQGPVE